MQNILIYGDERIPYRVEFDAERAGKIAVSVSADGSVVVNAPEGETIETISRAVNKRARWIVGHVEEAQKRFEHVRAREYVSGETVLYLGRRYVLKLLDADGKTQTVRLHRGRLEIPTEDRSPAVIRGRVRAWYRFRAREYFARRIDAVGKTLPWIDTSPPLQLLTMTTQWGSCAATGSVILNPMLIRAARDCVDYVVLHELCHLEEHNHSRSFYELLDRHMPGWRGTKAKLDNMAELLLNE